MNQALPVMRRVIGICMTEVVRVTMYGFVLSAKISL